MLSNRLIIQALAAYGANATDAQCELIRSYISLLLKWNRSISLTAITNEVDILKFHFGESVFALSALNGIKGRLADVGTGAGFPGLALRIFAENTKVLLIESSSKKCAFLNEAVRQLGVNDVCVLHTRFEDAVDSLRGTINVVTSRALGDRAALLGFSSEVLAPGGQVSLWIGKDGVDEVACVQGWRWHPAVPIPGSKHRFVIAGSPFPPK